ncbi:MAG: Asp-tRNA(Asn)/Glu-tRNA(Gln) amidotransferase subunit GatC [Firmicutes bacterium]|jgi:aspartyl-tRNA(Asn)/glutamyl-tRNA(Gln) amidotransferase subunit C|nr:Asp-tRNA(Asn)/Glu-tRNA(Gln) amidotransferase subunit GatC [Bacillota bacterium]
MKITTAEVEQVARLSRLRLTPEETEEFTRQINSVFAYAERLASVDTEGVPPTVNVLDLGNVWREDEVRRWLTQEEALANAAEVAEGCFRVPRIMEE